MRNYITSIPVNIFGLRFDTRFYKLTSKICCNFKFVSFEPTEKQPIKERHSSARPVHHGYPLYAKLNIFSYISHVEKVYSFR